MKKLSLLLPFLFATSALAQDTNWGERFYVQHCATCHGVDAQGGGDLTELLTIPVPDLTTLSAGNDGEFPMLHVIQVIDGRSGLRAHEEPMPRYGALFSEDLAPPLGMAGAAEPLVRGRVLSIAEYIHSIQQ